MSKQGHNSGKFKRPVDPWRFENPQPFSASYFFEKLPASTPPTEKMAYGNMLLLNTFDATKLLNYQPPTEGLLFSARGDWLLKRAVEAIYAPLVNYIVADSDLAEDIFKRRDVLLRQQVKFYIDKGITLEVLERFSHVPKQWIKTWLAIDPETPEYSLDIALHGTPSPNKGISLADFDFSKGLLNSLRLFLACCLLNADLKIAEKHGSAFDMAEPFLTIDGFASHAKYSQRIAALIINIAKNSDIFGNVRRGYRMMLLYEKPYNSADYYYDKYIEENPVTSADVLCFLAKKQGNESIYDPNANVWELGQYAQAHFYRALTGIETNASFFYQSLLQKNMILPNGRTKSNLRERLLRVEENLESEPDSKELWGKFVRLCGYKSETWDDLFDPVFSDKNGDSLKRLDAALTRFCFPREPRDYSKYEWQTIVMPNGDVLIFPELLRQYDSLEFDFDQTPPIIKPVYNNGAVHPVRSDGAIWALPAPRPLNITAMGSDIFAPENLGDFDFEPHTRSWDRPALPLPRRASIIQQPTVPDWFHRDWRPPVPMDCSVTDDISATPIPDSLPAANTAVDVEILTTLMQQLAHDAEQLFYELGKLPVMERRELFRGDMNLLTGKIKHIATLPFANDTVGGAKLRHIAGSLLNPADAPMQLTGEEIGQTQQQLSTDSSKIGALLKTLSHLETVFTQIRRQLDKNLPKQTNVTIVTFDARLAMNMADPLPRVPANSIVPHDAGALANDIADLANAFDKRGVPDAAVNVELARRYGNKMWWPGKVSNLFKKPHTAQQHNVDQLLQILLELDDQRLDMEIDARVHTLIPGANFWKNRAEQAGGLTLDNGDHYEIGLITNPDGGFRVIVRKPDGMDIIVNPKRFNAPAP